MNRVTSSIGWARNPDGTPGYTWNPITGCLNGCEYCYARKLANTRLKERYLANKNLMPVYVEGGEQYTKANDMLAIDPFYPRFWEDRLDELNPVYGQDHRAKFKGIFVCDMSDLFGIGIPEEWTRKVLDRISEFYYHRFYLLTKQPQNLIKFSPFPDNCWAGVTITEGNTDAGLYLAGIEASIKFISFEPLLKWANYGVDKVTESFKRIGINWVIIGAQTKPYKPPKIEWVQEIVQACDKAGVAVFLKHNLLPLLIDQPRVPSWSSDNHGLRQEMPK